MKTFVEVVLLLIGLAGVTVASLLALALWVKRKDGTGPR